MLVYFQHIFKIPRSFQGELRLRAFDRQLYLVRMKRVVKLYLILWLPSCYKYNWFSVYNNDRVFSCKQILREGKNIRGHSNMVEIVKILVK